MKGPRKVVEKRNPERQRDSTRTYDPMEHPEKQPRGKRYTASYRAYQEVRITTKIDSKREREVADFVTNRIAEYKGKTEENHGRVPHMLFERQADAHRFARALHSKLGVPREHVEVKAFESTDQ